MEEGSVHEAMGRGLHFIVRDPRYRQSVGYALYMDKALGALNHSKLDFLAPAESWDGAACNLLEQAASVLRNPDDVSYNHCIEEGKQGEAKEERRKAAQLAGYAQNEMKELPPEFRDFMELDPVKLAYNTSRKKELKKIFGPAADPLFGQRAYMLDGVNITPIDATRRGYLNALKHNFNLPDDADLPDDFSKTFSYQYGNTHLPLMRIRPFCEETLRSLLTPETIHTLTQSGSRDLMEALRETYGGCRHIFVHPECDAGFFEDVGHCLDPLLQKLEADAPGAAGPKVELPKEKLEALAEIYWLVAQSTPVVRGGSAYANLILEHLVHRLHARGYGFDLPYMKEGVDLWAQAVSLPLEGFKTRFKEGLFFDREATGKDVSDYFLAQLRTQKQSETQELKEQRDDELHVIQDRLEDSRGKGKKMTGPNSGGVFVQDYHNPAGHTPVIKR